MKSPDLIRAEEIGEAYKAGQESAEQRIAALERELAEARRQIDEGIKSQFRVEQALGMVLYGTSEEGLPLWGEHTAETLASQAARKLRALKEASQRILDDKEQSDHGFLWQVWAEQALSDLLPETEIPLHQE